MDREIKQIKRIYSDQSFEKKQKKNKEVGHLRKVLFSLVGEVKSKKILFLGSGDGQECVPYIEAGANITGIDLSETLILSARQSLPENRFIVGDFHDLVSSNSYNLVISILSIHYSKNLTRTLSKIRDLLAPNGRCFIATTHRVYKMNKYNSDNYFRKGKVWYSWKGIRRFNYFYLIEDYINVFAKTGFVIESMKEVYTPKYSRSEENVNIEFPIFTIYVIRKV